MGWWDSLWPSSSSEGDPLRNLDPKLREFLEKESPLKYGGGEAAAKQPEPQTRWPRPGTRTNREPGAQDDSAEDGQEQRAAAAVVPKESQFPDGRYAHLWRTYRPLAEVEAETKSDHEKLMDVLEAYKERRSQIGRAALENCALEQVDWRACMTNPSVADRMTLCRAQVKRFERCYTMQTRFLKALGYLSATDRSPEEEERIQMHADTLFHRMLAQEAEVEKAKDEGRPVPQFSPILATPPTTTTPITTAATNTTGPDTGAQGQGWEVGTDMELTPEEQKTMRERLEKVPEEERAAEAEAIKGELRAKAEVASRVKDLWAQQERDRLARLERGEQTVWDRVTGVFRYPSSPSPSSASPSSSSSSASSLPSEDKK